MQLSCQNSQSYGASGLVQTTEVIYKRRPGACENCRLKKTRCDGGYPECRKCQVNGVHCRYLPSRKRGRLPANSRASISKACHSILPTRQEEAYCELRALSSATTDLDSSPQCSEHTHETVTTISDFDTQLTYRSTELWNDVSHQDFMCPEMPISMRHASQGSMLFDLTVQLPSAVGHMSIQCLLSSNANPLKENIIYTEEDEALDTIDTGGISGRWDLEVSPPVKRPSLLVLDTTKALVAKLQSHAVNSEEMQAVLIDLLDHVDAQGYSRKHTTCPDASTEFLKDVTRSHGLVEEADFVEHSDEILVQGIYDPTKSCLVHSLIALAFTGHFAPPSISNRADHNLAVLHYDKAISAANEWRRTGCSILMFKVEASRYIDPSDTDLLLQDAVAISQRLKLESPEACGSATTFNSDMKSCQISFWHLYAMEKPYRWRLGQVSFLNDDFIHHQPPFTACDSDTRDDTRIGLRFAMVISNMSSDLYSREAVLLDGPELAAVLEKSKSLIDDWYADAMNAILKTTLPGRQAIHLQYYELLLSMHRRMLQSGTCQILHEDSFRAVATAALRVLEELAVDVDPSQAAMDRIILGAVISAFCVVSISVDLFPDGIAVLHRMCSALGFLARVSTLSPFPLDKLDRVFRLVEERTQQQRGCAGMPVDVTLK